MELRRKVKLPKRYESDLIDSPYEERELGRTSKYLPASPSDDFNPSLRPAAFPTISPTQVVPSQATQQSKLSEAEEEQLFTQHPHHFSEYGGHEEYSSTTMTSASTSVRKMNGIFPDRKPSSIVSPGKSDGLETSDSSGNPTYERNVKAMMEACRRSSHEWNILEMETSDEDNTYETTGASNQKTSSIKVEHVGWEEVSVAHQLEILRALLEMGHSKEEAMEQLGLNASEKEKLVEHHNQHQKRVAAEDSRLGSLRSAIHQRLLEGNGNSSVKLTQSTYRRWFDNHLSEFLNAEAEDYNLTTVSDLEKAQTFLTIKGLHVSLASRWRSNGVCSNAREHVQSERKIKHVKSAKSTRAADNVNTQAEALDRASNSIATNSTPTVSNNIVSDSSSNPLTIRRKRQFSSTIPAVGIQPGSNTQSNGLAEHTETANLSGGQVNVDKSDEKARKSLPFTSSRKKKLRATTSRLSTQGLNEKSDSSGKGPLKLGVKRTLSGSVSNVSSTQNHVQNSRSDSSARKGASRVEVSLSGAVKEDDSTLIPIKRLKGLTITNSADSWSLSSRNTPPSEPSSPSHPLSQSSTYKGLRSSSARRLPSKYSDTSLDQGSDDSLKDSSYKKQVGKKRSNLSTTGANANAKSKG